MQEIVSNYSSVKFYICFDCLLCLSCLNLNIHVIKFLDCDNTFRFSKGFKNKPIIQFFVAPRQTNSTCVACQMVFGFKQIPTAECVIFLSDIDECAADRSLCQPYGSCENRQGSYMCVCNHGYVLSEDKHSCERKLALTPPALLKI